MGFPVPFAGWAAGDWNNVARDVLLDRRARERGITDPPASRACSTSTAPARVRGGDAIWALLNLELWYRTFIDGDGVQTLPSPSRPISSTTATPARATAGAHTTPLARDVSAPPRAAAGRQPAA